MTERQLDANHERIWLSPRCDDERTWCKDNVFDTCSACGQRAVEYIRADLAAAHPSTGGEGGVRVKGLEEAWRELVEKDDRTSPAEHPDMVLITKGELGQLMGQDVSIAFISLCGALGLQPTPLAYLDATAARARILTAIEPVAASPSLQEAQTSVPDGYKLVPVEPTDVMLYDGYWAAEGSSFHDLPAHEFQAHVGDGTIRDTYCAMLAAAPTSPEPSPASEDVLRAAEIDAKFTEREKTVRMGRDPVAELRQEAADQTEGACLRIELVASNFPQGHAGGAVLREAVSTIRRYAPPAKEAAE